MPPDALINAYLEGQVSRRTFIRRLVASGISLGAAITYADALWAQPAWAATPDDVLLPRGAGTADVEIQVTTAVHSFRRSSCRMGPASGGGSTSSTRSRNDLGFLNSGLRPGDAYLRPGRQRHLHPPVHRLRARSTTSASTRRRSIRRCSDRWSCRCSVNPRRTRSASASGILWALVPAPPGFGYRRPDQTPRRAWRRRRRRWASHGSRWWRGRRLGRLEEGDHEAGRQVQGEGPGALPFPCQAPLDLRGEVRLVAPDVDPSQLTRSVLEAESPAHELTDQPGVSASHPPPVIETD